jgi:hypothetical protein
MSVFSWLGGLFKTAVDAVKQCLALAQESGLDDQVVSQALYWVRIAAEKYVDNADRREWVVKILAGRGVPESVARIAVEFAYQIYKREVAPKIG